MRRALEEEEAKHCEQLRALQQAWEQRKAQLLMHQQSIEESTQLLGSISCHLRKGTFGLGPRGPWAPANEPPEQRQYNIAQQRLPPEQRDVDPRRPFDDYVARYHPRGKRVRVDCETEHSGDDSDQSAVTNLQHARYGRGYQQSPKWKGESRDEKAERKVSEARQTGGPLVQENNRWEAIVDDGEAFLPQMLTGDPVGRSQTERQIGIDFKTRAKDNTFGEGKR